MTPPEQSEAPKGPRPPAAPPAGTPSASESAPRGTGADAGASAGSPNKPEIPASSASPNVPEPTTDTPDQVAVLQTVVEKLATPTTKAAAAPRSGYTPRVFAFDRPPKTAAAASGSVDKGTRPQGSATPGATSASATPGSAAPAAPASPPSSGEGASAAPEVAAFGAAAAAAGVAAGGAAASAAGASAAGASPEPTTPRPTPEQAAASSTAPQGRATASAADGPEPVSPAKSTPEAAAPATGEPETAAAPDQRREPAETKPAAASKPAAEPAGPVAPVRQEPAATAPQGPAAASERQAAAPVGPQPAASSEPAKASGARTSGATAPDVPAAKAEPAAKAAPATKPASAAAGAAAAPAAAAAAGAGAATAGAADAANAASVPAPPVLPAPPSVPPRSLIPPSGAVQPGAAPPPGTEQNSFLKPLTGAIQRVAGTRWAPVRPDAAPLAAAEQGPAGPHGPGPHAPGAPYGPGGPGGPGPADQGGFFGLAGDGAPSRGPRIALFAVLAVVLLFGIYALVAWTQSDTVPRDTTVAGVDVGGMTRAEATSALTDQLAPRAKEPISLTAGEGKAQLSPESSGLAIDAEATTAELTEFSLSPTRMWAHLFGGSEEELVLAVDEQKFSSAVAGLEDSLAVDAVDGTVAFVDGQAAKTDPEEGSRIVASETARIIKERWIVEEGPYDLPIEPVAPKISQQETDEAFAVAQKVVSAPVTVSVGNQTPQLAPEVLAGLIRFEQKDDALGIVVDSEATVQAIVDGTTNLLEVPDDAHFEFVGGRPTVVEGRTGTTLDPAEAGKAVRVAATSDDRETSVELVEQDPEETVESLEKLGVKEVVSEFHTPLTNEPVRTQNLVRGAEMITGHLIKPGETFSLLEALAPITLENGYFDAGVVEDGKHVEAVGGGLSQMATTTFNAGFFAGYEDVEHHAHSYWFPRYPPGREATIYVGAKDMKFTNDTPYGAVMQSYVAGGELWVKIWSTKHYTVEESNTGKTNVVPTTVIEDSSADCEPYPGGEDGFSIGITRKVYLDGQLAKENSFNHRYNPDNPVVCK